jgi:hypothetical protein
MRAVVSCGCVCSHVGVTSRVCEHVDGFCCYRHLQRLVLVYVIELESAVQSIGLATYRNSMYTTSLA